jgi:hypothetical protein
MLFLDLIQEGNPGLIRGPVEEVAQPLRVAGALELGEGLGLDLPYALAPRRSTRSLRRTRDTNDGAAVPGLAAPFSFCASWSSRSCTSTQPPCSPPEDSSPLFDAACWLSEKREPLVMLN